MAALELTTALDSDELPDSDAERLRAVVEALDLDDLARRSPLRGAGADRYQYELVVSDGGARHEVTVSEDAAPAPLRALIDWLVGRAQQERRGPRPQPVVSRLQSEAEQVALLERHRPQLRYDAQEPYRTMGADSICENPGNHLARKDGAVLARAGGGGEAALSLDLLSEYPAGLNPAADDRLDEAEEVLSDARLLQGHQRFRDRVYGRTLSREGRLWLQYWFWLYYNPKHLLGFGRHEGDWEMIQLGLDNQGEPELVTYAQHDRGERKRFSETAVVLGSLGPV